MQFRGRPLTSAKSFFQGTQRSRSPEATLALIEGLYTRVGLTRLADITGLDRIGIPVVVGIRPNAASIVCSAGKGMTRVAAQVSAAMESIEAYYAETARPEGFVDSFRGAQSRAGVIDPERLTLWQPSLFDEERPERWALGWDLVGQQEVAVPLVQVLLHGFGYEPLEYRSFAPSGSNGLASGNNLVEAICSGLYELIERDALTCTTLAAQSGRLALGRVDLEQVGGLVMQLRQQLKQADFELVLIDRSVDTQVPVYHAVIFDRQAGGAAAGYGAHLDPQIAQLRAITEAVQSRAVLIAGARDDLFRHRREELERLESNVSLEALQGSLTVQAEPPKNLASESFEGDLRILLDRLCELGFEQVIVFELSEPDCPVSVVRVLVPGLEGYQADYYSPGVRARNWHS